MTEPHADGGGWPPVQEIDPGSVPGWPHPVVTARSDGIDIDGHTLPLPDGVDPQSTYARQLALKAVADSYAELNRPIRVRARDADGTGWDLVLAPDGAVAPIGEAPVEYPGGKATRRRSRPGKGRPAPGRNGQGAKTPDKRRGLVAVAVFAVAVIALGVTFFALTRQGSDTDARPKHTSASTPPPANLPVSPPPGYGTRASWAVPYQESSRVAVTPAHKVAMLNPDGDLEVRDAGTGVLEWSANLPFTAQGELHSTTIDGAPVLALGGLDSLVYWRLDDPEHVLHQVKVPAGGTVSFLGPSPLITLPDQTAAYIGDGKAKLVDVPVGAKPVSATGSEVLAVNKAGKLWRLRDDHEVLPQPKQISRPDKHASVLRAVHIPNGMFLVAWQAQGQRTLVLYDSPGGAERSRKAMSDMEPGAMGNPLAEESAVMASDTGSVVAIGDTVVFPYVPQAYNIAGLQPITASGGHLYANDESGEWLDITSAGEADLAGEDSVPAAVDGATVFVPAQKLNKTLLYALAAPANSAEPSTSETPAPTGNSVGRPVGEGTAKRSGGS